MGVFICGVEIYKGSLVLENVRNYFVWFYVIFFENYFIGCLFVNLVFILVVRE